MKDNGYKIFKGLDDETVDRISEKFPVLTDRDREKLFSKSEKKYNKEAEMGITKVTAKQIFKEGDEVSGVDRYTGRMWRRYATTAAAFVVLAGGVGGSIALAMNMNKSRGIDEQEITEETSEVTTTGVSDNIIVTETTSAFETETTVTTITEEATTEIETVAEEVTQVDTVRNNLYPEDLDAFNREWVEKWVEFRDRIYSDGINCSSNPLYVQLSNGYSVELLFKIEDKEFKTADDIHNYVNSVFVEGAVDVNIPDVTNRINKHTGVEGDFSDNFVIYDNELYGTCNIKKYNVNVEPLAAERLNNNEMLIHWNETYMPDEEINDPDEIAKMDPRDRYRFEDGTEGEDINGNQTYTMHLVWKEECGGWRADDVVKGDWHFGKPTKEEAAEMAQELFNGYKDVHAVYRGTDVEYDHSHKMTFTYPQSGGAAFIYYSKITSDRFSTLAAIREYLSSKYTDELVDKVMGGDFTDITSNRLEISKLEDLGLYIERNGDLQLCVDGGNDDFSSYYMYLENEMQHDPKVVDVRIRNGNEIIVKADNDTAKSEDRDPLDSIAYTILRGEDGQWKIAGYDDKFSKKIKYIV